MASRMARNDVADSLGRLFYPASIAVVLAVLAAAYVYLEPEFAVFGLYALVGLVGGATVYYGTSGFSGETRYRIDEPVHRAGVYASVAVTVGAVALTGEPLVVLFGLAVGYALVVRQLFADSTPERLIPQLTALFLLSPVTKYVTAGQYVGHGDLLSHTRFTEDILASGSVQTLVYTSYQEFPGLHLIAATVGSLSGLGAYDGIMLTGLAAFAVLLPAVYLIVARVTGHRTLGLYTAFAVVLLDDASFFASYAFPQSLATVLIVVLALLATLVSRDELKWRVAWLFALVAVALSVVHHLTQVLILPVIGCAALLYAVHGRDHARSLVASRQMALFSLAAVVTGVRLVRTGFVDRLFEHARLLVLGGIQGGYTRSVTLGFGRPPRSSSVSSAVDWLVSPYGLYLVLLLLVFSVGVIAYLRADEWSAAQTALFWTGALGAALVFETPLSIKSLIRIRLAWLFVFAFVIGIGLLQFRDRVGSSRRAYVLLAVVVVLAATAPMVTADNYYDLDPRPTVQTSFSDQEVAELQAVSTFATERDRSMGAFWLTQLAMERNHVDESRIERSRLEGDTLILPPGHFVYRSQWPEHKVHFRTDGEGEQLYSNTMYVSEDWLDQRTRTGNKVYSAGGTGVMWRPDERPFEDM